MEQALQIELLSQTDISYERPIYGTDSFKDLLTEIKHLNRLPLLNLDIIFSDDVWDFSSRKRVNIADTKFRIKFNRIPPCFIESVKTFAFIELTKGTYKIQTLSEKIKILSQFLVHQEEQGLIDIEDFTIDSISLFFSEGNFSLRRQQDFKSIILKFLQEYSSVIKEAVIDPEIIRFLEQRVTNATVAMRNNSKLPDIPKEYFNKLLDVTLKVTKSKDPEDIKYHAIANILIILMQTGLRIGELCALRTDCMHVVEHSGKRFMYLNYDTWKREKGTNVYSQERTFVNELSEYAINNLINEYKEKRQKIGIDYLLVDTMTDRPASWYPVSGEEFSAKYLKKYYCYINKYMPTINLPESMYPELSRTKLTSFYGDSKSYRDKVVVHPLTEQYRVRVCTDLYHKGVDLEFIRKFMGHLSTQMEGYYARPDKVTQEDENFSHQILEGIISGELEPLGGKESLKNKIEEFISENHYNVSTDMDEICRELMKKVPIRQKFGGVCIKSSQMRDCSVDAATNEFYCAYNVCPNIYHFYYMANITYKQAQDLQAGIKINEENNFLRQAEKDKNMLKTLTINKLIPELDSLQRYVARDGKEKVLARYPELGEIVENFDAVYAEATRWTCVQ